MHQQSGTNFIDMNSVKLQMTGNHSMFVGNRPPHWLSSCLSESLLDLRKKLQQAEKCVHGKVSSSALLVEECNAGVCSCIDNGKLKYVYKSFKRKHDNLLKNTAVNGVRPVTELSIPHNKSVTPLPSMHVRTPPQSIVNNESLHFHTLPPDAAIVQETDVQMPGSVGKSTDIFDTDAFTKLYGQLDIAELCSENIPAMKKLTLLDRQGPSLWPFLSSVKTSVDNDHIQFLSKSPYYLSSYNNPSIQYDYVRPLSDDDVETILNSAVDTALQVRKASFLARLSNGLNSSSPVKVTNDYTNMFDISKPHLPPDGMSSATATLSSPMTVSKRYAAAIANPRRYKCNLCPYSTDNRSHVRRHHISVHSDARPYRCYVCGKEFARSENAKVHMQSRHVGIPYDPEKIKSKHYMMLTGGNDSLNMSHDSKTPTPVSASPSATPLNELDDDSVTNQTNELLAKKPHMEAQNTVNNISNGLLFSSALSYLANGTITNGSNQTKTDFQFCPHCRYPCRDAADLLRHLASSHAETNIGIPISTLGTTTFAALAGLPQINSHVGLNEICPSASSIAALRSLATPLNLYSQLASVPGLATLAQSVTPIGGFSPLINPVPAFGATPLNSVTPLFATTPQINATVAPALSYMFLNNVTQPSCSLPVSTQNDTTKSSSDMSGSEMQSAARPPVQTGLPVTIKSELVNDASTSGNQHFRPILPKNEKQPESVVADKVNVSLSTYKSQRPPRSFKTFYCLRCPDRAPFRYKKSFNKHLAQHRVTDELVGGVAGASHTRSPSHKLPHLSSETVDSDDSSEHSSVDDMPLSKPCGAS